MYAVVKSAIICLCVSVAFSLCSVQRAKAEEPAELKKEKTEQKAQQQIETTQNNEILEELKELKKRITELESKLEEKQKEKGAALEEKQGETNVGKRTVSKSSDSVAQMSDSVASHAEGFLLGAETKGVTLKADKVDLNIRIRLQPRVDYGDIIKSKDGNSYASDKDLYFRRIRLEFKGSLFTKIKYALILNADNWEKTGNTNVISVYHAYLLWELDKAFSLMVGKENLPYSRVSLTSSSEQLIIERAVSTEAAKKLFGIKDVNNPYNQPKLEIRGKFIEGVAAYQLAVADGWHNGDSIQTGLTVYRGSPVYIGRIELSPPGWTEDKRSDAHLGQGKHLTLGIDYAAQNDIRYKENNYEEDRTLAGVDLSGHYKGLTAQLEYNTWKVKSTDPSKNKQTPNGWYAQAGYFIDGVNLEPVARYEIYDQDSNSSDKKETNTTIGLNWYLKAHNLKLGLNWVHSEYENSNSNRLADSDKKNVYQLQGQIYF